MPEFEWTDFTRTRVHTTSGGNSSGGGAAALQTASGNKACPIRRAKLKAQIANDPNSVLSYSRHEKEISIPAYKGWLSWILGE